LSGELLGIRVSATEVSNALKSIVPAAKAFLERPLAHRKFMYLYVDGTNFLVRRSTVGKEPTLVVLGVDETGRKSVLSMVQGDKDNRRAWESVFSELKARGLDPSAVKLGIMDGLPGLADAFTDAFTGAQVARCWVHKCRNVMPRVPRKYQALFQADWDAIAYAESKQDARNSFQTLKERWTKDAGDAVVCLEKNIDVFLTHYDFPRENWDALRTTNPIERVNKEFKRRSKAMEVIGPDGLKALLAFTALRLEFGWSRTPITAPCLKHLKKGSERQLQPIDTVIKSLLN
jgi:putative transposase